MRKIKEQATNRLAGPNWVNFGQQADPAYPIAVKYLKQKLDTVGIPKVLCFWTRDPAVITKLYQNIITDLIQAGCLVLAQVTPNNYGNIEPGIENTSAQPENAIIDIFEPLIDLLGGSDHIRLRFGPILPLWYKRPSFPMIILAAYIHKIDQITISFQEPGQLPTGGDDRWA